MPEITQNTNTLIPINIANLITLSTTFGGNASGASLGFQTGYSKRNWVDDQTTLIGENSVNINVGTKDSNGNYTDNTGNTNIIGAVIANSTNGKIGSEAIDGGNLTFNTKSLTFSDIIDTDKAKQFGMNLGFQDNNKNNQGTANIALNYSMHDIEQLTKATIGNGSININNQSIESLINNNNPNNQDNPNNSINLASLNRNINETQEITKNQSVSQIDIKLSHDWGKSPTSDKNQLNTKPAQYLDQKLTELLPQESDSTFYKISNSFKNHLTQKLDEINPTRSTEVIAGNITLGIQDIQQNLNIPDITVSVGKDNQYKNLELKNKDDKNILQQALENKDNIKVTQDQNDKTKFYATITNKDNEKQILGTIELSLTNLTIDQAKQNPSLIANSLSSKRKVPGHF